MDLQYLVYFPGPARAPKNVYLYLDDLLLLGRLNTVVVSSSSGPYLVPVQGRKKEVDQVRDVKSSSGDVTQPRNHRCRATMRDECPFIHKPKGP